MKISSYNKAVKSIIVKSALAGKRLDYVLSILLPNYSRSQIKRWILDKKISINNQISILPRKKMNGGELIVLRNIEHNSINHCNVVAIPQDIPLNIIYEDDHIVVINKPSNMVVHPGSGNYQNTILNALLFRYPANIKISERAGIVHRLDKDTSGLMIVAKTHVAYNNLLKSFKERKVVKEYDAIVFGNFFCNTGVINKPIIRNANHRTCMMVHDSGKTAITRYFVTEAFDRYSRLRIRLETGRTHQIRVHMAYINHPLIGDQKYSKFISYAHSASGELNNYLRDFSRQALHACTLQLLHPITNTEMQWHAPLPIDILGLISILQKNHKN